ncbi:MAG: Uma2 family endonuclease [Planctomycetota bacterium]|nr:Uma2 family endonuclease [Planctomycetota bacterium]MDA1139282.1 Uma2 family endonuclease [Planctomycetota bacterium]
MSQSILASPIETFADLHQRLGAVPLERIRLVPSPGHATEQDVVEIHDRTNQLFELVDGVLVEKAMGFMESRLAAALIGILEEFLKKKDLGIVLAPDGMMRLAPGLVRMPDVSFLSWEHFPDREPPTNPVPNLVPDLAVEILSKSNTPGEMRRKLHDYFESGVRLVWYLDPETKCVEVFTEINDSVTISETGILDGSDTLPGFSLRISDWFSRAWKSA